MKEFQLKKDPPSYEDVKHKPLNGWQLEKELIRDANPIQVHTWKDGKQYEWPLMRSAHPTHFLEELWRGPVKASQMLEDLASDAERIFRLLDLLTLQSQHGGETYGFDELLYQIRSDQRTLCNALTWLADKTPSDDGSVINEVKDSGVAK